ncbi:MAG: septum formation initiator family protein [Alphaproteobacteria bacterium]|jgi:cell division protein FtsB|nr:septum formation initiator family protein [Alphaproteobacteria bacterium]
MDVLYALRARARQIIGPVLGCALCAYFAYHLVEGDRGLLALWNLQTQVHDAKATLAKFQAERAPLAQHVALLQGNHLDRDYLDERVHAMLNYAAPDEIVLYYDQPTK